MLQKLVPRLPVSLRSLRRPLSSSSLSYHSSYSSSSSSSSSSFSSSSTTAARDSKDREQRLHQNVRMLGGILGEVIQKDEGGLKTLEAIEKLRKLGRQWRQPGQDKGSVFDEMVGEVKKYSSTELLSISRGFTHFLALSNSAENTHRVRRIRERTLETNNLSPFSSKVDTCYGSILRLKNDLKVSDDKIFDAITKQKVEIVLTAHPTEVNRRTIIQKHQRINYILEQLDKDDMTLYEKSQLTKELKMQVASIWESDEIRRSKPTPVDEAKVGLAIAENVLWNCIPHFLRKLDDVCRQNLNKSLPLNVAPLAISSWMGGDRDGNPNVTPEITLEVTMMSKWTAATLLRKDIHNLRNELSLEKASEELIKLTNNSREPYRKLLKDVENRLVATVEWCDQTLRAVPMKSSFEPYFQKQEILDSLLVIHRSLVETNHVDIAEGNLTDVIRKLEVFGLNMLPLDIRQESTRHSEALDAITQYLGLGSYLSWDEETRRSWLSKELESIRPLLPRTLDIRNGSGWSDKVIDTLSTFMVIASLGTDSFGAYVISQCQQASDVLAVKLLQKEFGAYPHMRVVPLFETLDDLVRSKETIDALFSIPAYRKLIGNKHEIMVGYSDSAKDAGRLAASWAQYKCQTDMVGVAKRHGVDLTFFHGKGGTIGRGGNPALYQAILAHPPNTINGLFRVTEQGENITQNLGVDAMAERTLDLFTSGVLTEKFLQRPEPKKEWVDCMERLSSVSCASYRHIVREEPRFVPYFRTATPEQELAGLNIGSRPAKRNPKGGVESLRAIPWVFSWTQTRLNLPTWLGVGEAIEAELQTNPAVIREMYREWPWFRTLIDLLEMILIKSEERVAENYDVQLVSDPESLALGKELRKKLRNTAEAVLSVSGHSSLQVNNPVLLGSLKVRNPYVDSLNVIQAELLKRYREAVASDTEQSKEEAKILQNALLVTINGIANGMRNSG